MRDVAFAQVTLLDFVEDSVMYFDRHTAKGFVRHSIRYSARYSVTHSIRNRIKQYMFTLHPSESVNLPYSKKTIVTQ